MSRLLHAAARGARIEKPYPDSVVSDPVVWVQTKFVCTAFGDLQRIHPDDEHLQYGPISTALLKLAEDDSWNPSEERALALAVARQFQVYFGDEPDFELFYLILAEFLADEGM